MGRFGSLFRKSDEKEKAEPPSNPYAQQPSTDTYTQSNSYAAAQNRQVPSGLPSGPRTGLPSGPRPGSSAPPPYTQSPSLYSKDSPTFPSDSKRQDSGYQTGSPAFSNYQQSPNLPSGGSSPAVGYGNDRFGAPAGYGSNRYDNYAAYEQNNHNTATSQRTGGYGGLGGSDNELFSNNFVPPSQRNPISAPALPDNYDQMTEEDKQEAEINYKKQEIKQLRGDTEASQLRSLAMLGVAHETADNAMDSLHRQREMINHTNDAMRRANVQARVAEANVKDLRDANKSMFNPYAMSRKRREALNEERLIAEMQERDEKYQMQQELRQGNAQANQRAQGGPSPSFFAIPKQDRSRFDFENDEEDEEQEQRISNNEELLYKGVTLLKHKAINMGEEVEDQNPMIRQLNEKADIINDKVRKNHNDIKPYGA